MNQTAIFWPVIAHVLLVYVVFIVLRIRRGAAVRSGASVSVFKVRGSEPEISSTANGNILNQFELPVLFHSCCLALFVTAGANYAIVVLAWLFVLSRYLHAFIHLTSNRVLYRSTVFMIGAVILAIMWIWFALHIAGVA